LDDDLINSFKVETNQYAHRYLYTVGLSPHSRDYNYKDVTKTEMWAYFGISFMNGINRQPVIVLYWSTQPFFCTLWCGKKNVPLPFSTYF